MLIGFVKFYMLFIVLGILVALVSAAVVAWPVPMLFVGMASIVITAVVLWRIDRWQTVNLPPDNEI